MGFDTGVFSRYQNTIESPVNALMRGLEIRRAEQGNALQSMQMQDLHEQRQLQIQAAREAAAQKARAQNALMGMPSPQEEAMMQATARVPGQQVGPTPAALSRMPAVDPRAQAMHPLAQAGLIPFGDYFKARFPEQKLRDVAPGASVLDERTMKPVFTAAPKAAEAPSAIKEYEYAKGQGYQGTFEQWDTGRKKAGATNVVVGTGKVGELETTYRKEFNSLPEVTKYKSALPAFRAVESAASRSGPQADINLIYGLAKLYDPDSVVREGEYDTIANSQSIPEWLKGVAQKFAGGGRLTEQTKAQILTEARARIGTFENEFKGAQQTYTDIVRRQGLDPQNIFTPVGGYQAPKPPAPPKAASQNTVRTPDGQTFTFPNAEAAAKFRKEAGL